MIIDHFDNQKRRLGERFVVVNGCHGASMNDGFPSTKAVSLKFITETTNL